MLMLIGKRLWLQATLAVVASMVIVSMMACAAVMTFADHYEPLSEILLAVGVLAAGGLMQWGLARRLPDWQLA